MILFQYPRTNDPILLELKGLSGIDLSLTTTELEKAKLIMGYVHKLFTHNGDNEPSATDPLTIFNEARAGKSFRCVEYSTLANALLWAHKIPARVIGLKTKDVETREYGAGHVVNEFWSNDNQKWIMCDVQKGIIPMYKTSLLSAYELRSCLSEGLSVQYQLVEGSSLTPQTASAYSIWINAYLYFIDTETRQRLDEYDKAKAKIIMLVPDQAKPPKKFQNMFTMNATYTTDISEFYKKPQTPLKLATRRVKI